MQCSEESKHLALDPASLERKEELDPDQLSCPVVMMRNINLLLLRILDLIYLVVDLITRFQQG